MKENYIKKIVLIIGMCMMAMMFCTKTYAASVIGSASVTSTAGTSSSRVTVSYSHPSSSSARLICSSGPLNYLQGTSRGILFVAWE